MKKILLESMTISSIFTLFCLILNIVLYYFDNLGKLFMLYFGGKEDARVQFVWWIYPIYFIGITLLFYLINSLLYIKE